MRLLDLFCGAGGAAMGYHRAGFEVVGVDNRPMPRYPFEFHQRDALEFVQAHGQEFDVIHASPPCQAYVQFNNLNREQYGSVPEHVDLIGATRLALVCVDRPYIIENVVGAPLLSPVTLCGSMFGLGVRRHRRFESPLLLHRPHGCKHTRLEIAVYGRLDGRRTWTRNDGTEARAARTLAQASAAMGIDWMEWCELKEAIPPAFTQYIGEQLMWHLEDAA